MDKYLKRISKLYSKVYHDYKAERRQLYDNWCAWCPNFWDRIFRNCSILDFEFCDYQCPAKGCRAACIQKRTVLHMLNEEFTTRYYKGHKPYYVLRYPKLNKKEL